MDNGTSSVSPEADPSAWQTIDADGLSFKLLTGFSQATARPTWGAFTSSYDLTSDGDLIQRVLSAPVQEAASAQAFRDIISDSSKALIEGYTEVARVSWEQDESAAIERVFFEWGNGTQPLPGCTWLVVTDAGIGAVLLFGKQVDDGLRSGIEDSLTMGSEEPQ